jgi:hypothetical protein
VSLLYPLGDSTGCVEKTRGGNRGVKVRPSHGVIVFVLLLDAVEIIVLVIVLVVIFVGFSVVVLILIHSVSDLIHDGFKGVPR